MISLKQYKELKRVKLLLKELLEINQLLTRQMGELKPYCKYEMAKNCVRQIEESRYILGNYIKKYKKIVDNGKLE